MRWQTPPLTASELTNNPFPSPIFQPLSSFFVILTSSSYHHSQTEICERWMGQCYDGIAIWRMDQTQRLTQSNRTAPSKHPSQIGPGSSLTCHDEGYSKERGRRKGRRCTSTCYVVMTIIGLSWLPTNVLAVYKRFSHLSSNSVYILIISTRSITVCVTD